MKSGGRFERGVFYVETMNLFHTIDYHGTPSLGDLVVIRRLNSEEVLVEHFHGQPYIAVAQVLEFYELTQSEQGNGRYAFSCPD